MKKRSILIGLIAIIGVFMLSVITASAETEAYYTYSVKNGEATITDFDESISGEVIIPSTLGGYPVTTIGYSAFSGCTGLTSVTIPDGVTTIGGSAFSECTGLTSITIGDSVTTIGNQAFWYCTSLKKITVDEDNVFFSSKDGVLFSKDKTLLLLFPSGKEDELYEIPDSVTTIEDTAFYRCSGLTDITIPGSVTTIDKSAFSLCKNLTDITIPDGVITIGYQAFWYCENLTNITIPDSVKTIADDAFYGTGYYMEESNWENDSLYMGKHLIKVKSSVSGDYIIKDGVKTIADDAFWWCKNLTNIVIPYSVTTIGSNAFYGCSGLTDITIPDSVTTIGKNTFYGCSDLKKITVDEDNVFFSSEDGVLFSKDKTLLLLYPSGKKDVLYEIPDSVKTIGYRAFDGCRSLTDITIPGSVTTIGEQAFSSCTGLTSITILDGVITIGNQAFWYCENLTNITIPDSVTTIDFLAFSNVGYCMEENNWENDILYIGKHLIAAKSSITGNCTIKEGILTIADSAFYNCRSLTDITISDSVTIIGGSAFSGCENLTNITIPDSVTTIGERAFSDCENIKDVYYLDTEEEWNKINIEPDNECLLNAEIHYMPFSGTKTTVSDDGKTFTVTPINIDKRRMVIFALYNEEKCIEVQPAIYEGEALTFTTKADYTDVKVMVWGDLKDLKPICTVEEL